MSQPAGTPSVFAAFCAARLWPGLGPRLAGELADAGINGPEDVTSEALRRLPKVGPQRAGRLLSSWIAATPAYEVASLLVPAGLDARVAGRAVDLLGPGASRLLRDDPWQLLAVSGVGVGEADRVARAALPGITRDDPRRARALVGWVLGRQAREGHTVAPRPAVADALVEFGVGDTSVAIDAALESGSVVEADPTEPDGLIGLARYAEAEDGIAQGVARLIAEAKPITVSNRRAVDLDETQQAAVTAALRGGSPC